MDQHEKKLPLRVVSPGGLSRLSQAEAIDSVIAAVRDLAFGTVTITVHDSRVMQVDVTERLRFGS